jgi:flavin reductase (DIM6/NTAB) family NADH-FMN oxidoreductase RutF
VFATKAERKFDQVAWYRGTYGVPLLQGASCALEVELEDTLHASTHTIFIGRVQTVATWLTAPLIYTGGAFFDGSRLDPATSPSGA